MTDETKGRVYIEHNIRSHLVFTVYQDESDPESDVDTGIADCFRAAADFLDKLGKPEVWAVGIHAPREHRPALEVTVHLDSGVLARMVEQDLIPRGKPSVCFAGDDE